MTRKGGGGTAPQVGLRLWRDPSPELIGGCAGEMLERLGGPALVRVSGRDDARCRVVVTLLHGNEPSGLEAVHAWLRTRRQPAVGAVFVIAAVAAALQEPRYSHRMLPGGRDLNRCFAGPFDDRDGALAAAILAEIETSAAECVVDIHNNTGHNPAYAIATRIAPHELRLASLFARRFVHSDLRLGSLMEAVTDIPCVTVECGRVGDPNAAEVARAGIDRLLSLDRLEAIGGPAPEMEILESLVRVRARAGVRLAIGGAAVVQADLTISSDIDRHNFTAIPAGTVLGWVGGADWPIEACDATGRDIAADLFAVDGGALVAKRGWIPIMMTIDPLIALQDCLFYIVARRTGPVGESSGPAAR